MTKHNKAFRRLAAPLALSLLLLCGTLAGCNAKSDPVTEVEYTNVAITSFSLQENDTILENLESVFFSIDLVNAQVFNADSLPKGTDVRSLAVKIGTSVLSEALLQFTDTLGNAATVDYLTDPDAKINFAAGPVTLAVKSYGGTASRSYTIRVNVHREEADLLAWDCAAAATLPTNLSGTLTASRTVDFRGEPLVMTTTAQGACVARCSSVWSDDWTFTNPTLPAGADLNTLTAMADRLAMLCGSRLHTSPDGLTWTDEGVEMTHIYGSYGSGATLIGALRGADGTYTHVTFPAAATTIPEAIAAEMPVAGTSPLVEYITDWMDSPVAVMTGGRLADGTLTGATWGFDGTEWMKLNVTDAIPAASGYVVTPYFVSRLSPGTWTATRYSCLLCWGGLDADGKVDRTVYISTDYGMRWREADTPLQLPAGFPSLTGMQTIVMPLEMNTDGPVSARSAGWSPVETATLPLWMASAASRATQQQEGVTPITEWTTPYIFAYGGTDAAGKPSATMLRGVINRLKFKPLQ